MATQSVGTESGFHAVLALPSALVYLEVDWSVAERRSRAVFAEALAALEAERGAAGCPPSFRLDEEACFVESWLRELGEPRATGGGRVFWLREGRVVGNVIHAARLGVHGLIERTNALL